MPISSLRTRQCDLITPRPKGYHRIAGGGGGGSLPLEAVPYARD